MILPTPRLLVLTLVGTIPIVLAPTYDLAVLVALVWLAAMAVLAVVDARRVPLDALRWERQVPPRLSIAQWSDVDLHLRNASAIPIAWRLRDALPPQFVAEGNIARGTCPALGESVAGYRALPIHRGDYTLGPLTVRYLGPLGLAWRQRTVALPGDVQVYPDLVAIRRYEVLARRGALIEMGLHTTRRWGEGTEFERLRDYTGDDDIRRVSWTATARQHRPIAVDYGVERSQNVVVVLDAGRAMAGEVPRDDARRALTRLDYAVNAALLMAFVAQQYGDRIGVLAFSDRTIRYLPPRAGRTQFLALTNALYNLEAEGVESDVGHGLGELDARLSRRSLVVVFTDLVEPEAAGELVSAAVHLARRHVVVVVTLRDPGVTAMAELSPDDSESIYRRAIATTLLTEREEILRRLRAGGVGVVDVSAEDLSPAVVNRYLEVKARGL